MSGASNHADDDIGRGRRLAEDVLVAAVIVAFVVLLLVFSNHQTPAFIYQAF